MEFSASSKSKLKGVHPDLVRVVDRCAKDWKDKQFTFGLTCGVRSLEEQKVLVKKGASKTLKSRHIPTPNGYSHAVDVVAFIDGKVRWDWPLYDKIAKAMKVAAKAEKIPIEWGGDWVSFRDGPHFQLPWVTYPGTK
jgi:peptidoglycan L-alanyl-D-glutamate endopeptidase CwlK